jgi:hypothetical protein
MAKDNELKRTRISRGPTNPNRPGGIKLGSSRINPNSPGGVLKNMRNILSPAEIRMIENYRKKKPRKK